MRLQPVSGDDPREVLRALKSAIHGAGPALALGMPDRGTGPALPEDVAAGTAVIVTTSGSTGVPKSVVLSRSALTASALATAQRLGEGAWLLALPASYVAGIQVLVRSIVAGREPAIVSGSFSPQAFSAAALTMASSANGQRLPTFTSLVPAQLSRLLDAAEHDATVRAALASFERILIGGQSLPDAVAERAAAYGARISRTYGSTETSGGCVYDGRPLEGVAVRIRDGEVQLSGPTLADGYLGDAPRTDAVFLREGDARWYRTGDAGVVADGVLRVQGRIDNVIVSGGINISLDRVERLVRSVPGLADAVVVGVPDEKWGDASVIVVARAHAQRRSESDDLAAARDTVAAEIGPHARPARLVVVDEIAALPSGKPDRALLRRLLTP